MRGNGYLYDPKVLFLGAVVLCVLYYLFAGGKKEDEKEKDDRPRVTLGDQNQMKHMLDDEVAGVILDLG